MRTSPDSLPTTPAIGGRSVAKVPWPRRLLARRRGGSSGSSCGRPFSPAFWYISSASTTASPSGLRSRHRRAYSWSRCRRTSDQRRSHPSSRAILGGGGALGDAVEDQEDLRGAAMGPLQGGPGPGVEDAAAGGALVVDHRLAVAAVDAQA